MKTHPKFPEYAAVLTSSQGLDHPARIEVLGSQASELCFDCPGRECECGGKLCPITGVWLHVANLTKLRFAGYDMELDITEKTMSWKGD